MGDFSKSLLTRLMQDVCWRSLGEAAGMALLRLVSALLLVLGGRVFWRDGSEGLWRAKGESVLRVVEAV